MAGYTPAKSEAAEQPVLPPHHPGTADRHTVDCRTAGSADCRTAGSADCHTAVAAVDCHTAAEVVDCRTAETGRSSGCPAEGVEHSAEPADWNSPARAGWRQKRYFQPVGPPDPAHLTAPDYRPPHRPPVPVGWTHLNSERALDDDIPP